MKPARLAVLGALLLCALATGVGLSKLQWARSPALDWQAWQPYVVLGIVSALIVESLARWRHMNRLVAAMAVGAAGIVIAGAGWPLLVVAAFGIASQIVGSATLRALGVRRETPWVIAALVGAGLYGTVAGLAAHFPINTPPLYALAIMTPLLLGWRGVRATWIAAPSAARRHSSHRCADLAIAVVAMAHVAIALMPEMGHDALVTHLFVPGHLASRKSWGFDVDIYVWAVMPMMGDWIFSIVYMLAGEQASRLVNVGFAFANCLLLREVVRWMGGSPAAVKWAVLLFLATPLTFLESSSLYIESVWAAFVVAGAYLLLKAIDSTGENQDQLPAAGLLLGCAMAAKAVTLMALPALFVIFILHAGRWANARVFRHVAVGFGCILVIGAVPYATAWWLTANPLFPYFNAVFKSPLWPAQNFEDTRWSKGLQWNSLYRMTFRSDRFLEAAPGASGFHGLLLLLPATIALIAARNRRALLVLAVAICEIALTFRSIAYLRYVFPAFMLLVAVIGVALAPAPVNGRGAPWRTRWLAGAACIAVALNLMFLRSATNYGELSWRALLGPTERAEYLAPRLPIRNAVELINRLNHDRSPVAVFSDPTTAGLVSDAYYANWYNIRFEQKISAARSSADIAAVLLERGIDYLILDSNWGQEQQRAWIAAASDQISELGRLSVRKIKPAYRFHKQLLKNPRFEGAEGWTFVSSHGVRSSGGVEVTASAPAAQQVQVAGGRMYRNSVTASCAGAPSQGRVQVNWLDRDAGYIDTQIRVFDCTNEPSTQSLDVKAPANAVTAVVFASGHAEIPILVSEVGFY